MVLNYYMVFYVDLSRYGRRRRQLIIDTDSNSDYSDSDFDSDSDYNPNLSPTNEKKIASNYSFEEENLKKKKFTAEEKKKYPEVPKKINHMVYMYKST